MYFQEDDTNICSLLRIVDLGGLVVGGTEELMRQDGEDDEDDGSIPFYVFVKQLVKMCGRWDDKINENDPGQWSSYITKYVPKMVIQAVTATPGQEFAEEHLERIGFTKSGPFRKLKHPGTKLTFWHMTGDDFCASIGYESKYDERKKTEKAA
jgi:hypothetical protein